MGIYKSKTGYVKNIITNEILVTDTIYLGIYDSADNYTDITKDDYDSLIKKEMEKYHTEEESN